MDGWGFMVAVLLGVASCCQDWVSESEETVGPGDNITLYCDCKTSSGVYIVWYRDCSHENQPSLVLKVIRRAHEGKLFGKPLPRFQFVRNHSSESYDLMISNVTSTDEGLYYCGTEKPKVEDNEYITYKSIYTHGNVTTRIIIGSTSPDSTGPDSSLMVPSVPWMLMFTPAVVIFSSLLSFILVYHLCQKTENDQSLSIREQTKQNQDKDVFLTRVVFQAWDE